MIMKQILEKKSIEITHEGGFNFLTCYICGGVWIVNPIAKYLKGQYGKERIKKHYIHL